MSAEKRILTDFETVIKDAGGSVNEVHGHLAGSVGGKKQTAFDTLNNGGAILSSASTSISQ